LSINDQTLYEKEGQKFWSESMARGTPDEVFYPEKNAERSNSRIILPTDIHISDNIINIYYNLYQEN
jgi:hypothetical protein